MLIEAKGKDGHYSAEIPSVNSAFLEILADFSISEDKLRSILDKLDVAADVKSALFKISKVTMRVGHQIVQIGRKIIDTILALYQEYPTAGLGLLFGGILGFLAGSIPVLGFLLGPLITPLAMAYGFVQGVVSDMKDKDLQRKIEEANARFGPLQEAD